MTASKYWSDIVHSLEPYVPGEQPKISNLIKLNTNESPYPPSPQVNAVYSEQAIADLRLYPDPTSKALRETIAAYYSRDVNPLNMDNVFVGNGSDEVLAHAFQAFFSGRDEPLLFPDISYSFYPVYCGLYEIDSLELPLQDNFQIDFSQYLQGNGGIIFPNPNAPTSIAAPLSDIETLLKANTETVVVVDEAYVDFGAETAIALVNRYDNLLVVQTLSKSRSLAGARLGFAVGSKGLIDGMIRVKDSFNSYPVDRLTEQAGIAAFNDEAYFQDCCQKIINSRDWIVQALEKLDFEVLPSKANFIMAKPATLPAVTVFEQLRERNILVRYFNKPRIGDYLRITIGADTEMEALILAMREILA